MQLQHHFTVPVPVDVAWPAIIDPEQVAPCMPGATLTSSEDDRFNGTATVKLGPISLRYKGFGSFQRIDAAARRIVVDAAGTDLRGNGTAAATVTLTLAEADGGTTAQVDTDLKVTGKPAQLGRGLMSEVVGKVLHQFAANLARSLTGQDTAAARPESERAGADHAERAGGAADPADARDSGDDRDRADAQDPGNAQDRAAAADSGDAQDSADAQNPAVARNPGDQRPDDRSADGAEPPAPDGRRGSPDRSRHPSNGERPSGRNPAWRVTSPAAAVRTAPADAVAVTTTAVHGSASRADAVVTAAPVPQDEPVDLLGTADKPVLKRAVPLAAAALAAVLLLRKLRRRRG